VHRSATRPLRARPGQSARNRSRSAVYVSDTPDPFAINPIRRSFGLVLVSGLTVFGPLAIGGSVAMSVMVSVGWLAVTGLVIGVPILVWSLVEEGIDLIRKRLRPTVDQLQLSPRVAHVLTRHGYAEIDAVDNASDTTLLLLSNMDARGLHEVRRAINLWKYRRWQDQGFPATGFD
jgi:hypothetical protein